MKRATGTRRRAAAHITLDRAARLYRLVTVLGQGPRTRPDLLRLLEIGLRTFYRELEFLRRRGVKVRLQKKQYVLSGTITDAEGRLPCPDPQLSLAELAELAQGPGPAAQRLAALQEIVRGEGPGPSGSSGPKQARKQAKPKKRSKTK